MTTWMVGKGIVEEGSSKGVVVVVQQHVSLDTTQVDL